MDFRSQFTLLMVFSFLLSTPSKAQDSLFNADLSLHTLYFEIDKQGNLQGKGAELLKKEFGTHQYVLMGEFHNSPSISNFTSSIIPLLDREGFKHMVLEVGPHSAKVLKRIVDESMEIQKNLIEFHLKYGFYDEEEGEYITSIPFFDNVEDIGFLNQLTNHDWSYYGIDQEYSLGFLMLMDELYDGLSKKKRRKLKKLRNKVREIVQKAMEDYMNEGVNMHKELVKSPVFNEYLSKVAGSKRNNKIISDIHKSNEIYTLSGVDRKYYEAFLTRLQHFKDNFRNLVETNDLDLSKEKMLIKMGGLHTAKGYSPYETRDVGNMIAELASYYGNKSLHIGFNSRYYMEDGALVDDAADEKNPFRHILNLAKKDQWMVIDFRAFRAKTLFYPMSYKMHDEVRKGLLYNDLLIITPTDYDGTLLVPNKVMK